MGLADYLPNKFNKRFIESLPKRHWQNEFKPLFYYNIRIKERLFCWVVCKYKDHKNKKLYCITPYTRTNGGKILDMRKKLKERKYYDY